MFETKKSASKDIPTDPAEVLRMSEQLLRNEAPMMAVGTIYDAKAAYADSELRRRGIEGTHFVDSHRDLLASQLVQNTFNDGLGSNVFAKVATGATTLVYPGFDYDHSESEEEKRRNYFVSRMYRGVAIEVSGDDKDFEEFIVSALAHMEAKGRFYDIIRDSMQQETTGNLFDLIRVRSEIRAGRLPRDCADAVWQNIYFGSELKGETINPQELRRGVIYASAGMIRYREELDRYYAGRGVDDANLDMVNDHVMALMYLRRSRIKPGMVTDTLERCLGAIHSLDVDAMSKLIDDIIVDNPHQVTDLAAITRGLTSHDIEELRQLHDAQQQIKNSAVGRLAVMDEAQRAALAMLESMQDTDHIPAEVASMMGSKLLNVITASSKIRQFIYVQSQLKNGKVIFQWLHPIEAGGSVAGIEKAFQAPSPANFLNGILNGTIETSRDLTPEEIEVIHRYSSR